MPALIRPLLLRAAIVGAPAGLLALAISLASSSSSSAPVALDAMSFDASLPDINKSFDAKMPFDVIKLDGKPTDAKLPWGDVALDIREEAPKPIAPDPTPLACESVYVLTVKWDKGVLTLDKTRHEKLAAKAVLPRKFGRFAAELYVGPTLLERLRFDIPLLSDDDNTSAAYAKGLVTSVDVRIPVSDRPTRLEIWDRATDKRWVYPYPPKVTP
jgi:hypothetical protein